MVLLAVITGLIILFLSINYRNHTSNKHPNNKVERAWYKVFNWINASHGIYKLIRIFAITIPTAIVVIALVTGVMYLISFIIGGIFFIFVIICGIIICAILLCIVLAAL